MDDFAIWYTARHGDSPFPWQTALAQRIARDDWPEALTPPTGSGKTAVIDVWLWARLAGLPVPRRLVYVIDRRLVVDGVTHYAESLANTLDEAERPAVITLRGGMAIDEGWLTQPLHPTILVSTVDQVGSRLLFSGYGIRPRSAPIHAGLIGNDALFVVDEVHLARPLLQTLASVARLRGHSLGLPWRVLPMSATWDGEDTHGLTDADWRHPVLARRLRSSKPARLVRLKKDANLPERLAAEALALRTQGAEVVGIICNRVARARAVFERLRLQGDALLLTGRIRPHDKDALTAEALPRMAVQTRGRRAPLFVVATQTIEVGADLDLDAMVTECAPLSALRQRAGRLDRLGELERAPLVILYQPGERKTDPVYGEDLDAAWKWLESVASGRPKQVDFGIAALDALIASKPPPAERRPEAPSLLPAHLDLLAQTSVPHGIEIAPWLHGWETGPADVYLCWRADWGPDLAEAARAVEAAPPVQRELLAVPLHALRHWSAEIADLEGADPRDQTRSSGKHCIRWDGETAEPIRHDQARPGDTLILPSRAGGCDRFGWHPDSTAPVTDVGDDGRRVRLHPALRPDLAAEIQQLLDRDDASAADWRDLARRTAALDGEPGQVRRYPGGCVVLRAAEWTSRSALRPVALAVHQSAVAERAADFARLSGLAPDLIETLRKAGAGHDAGKADPRWQAMVGGDGSQVLAKGPGGDDPWLALPAGWRHEMASALLQKDGLARYLVGSHHGHGRPLLPAAPDPELWRRLGDWPALWHEFQHTHGHWGLAYLEALIRLADWTVSEEEQR